MSGTGATHHNAPIPGKALDPEPKQRAQQARRMDQRHQAAGVGFRSFQRFTYSNGALLAAGTGYYLFIALFAVVAFAYGLVALLGADQLSQQLTSTLNEAFPGLVGSEGIDPEKMRSVGQTTSIVGLLVLLYSGSGAVTAAVNSMHTVYGAPPDARNFVLAKLRAFMWLLLLGPLILISFSAGTLVSAFSQPILEWLGMPPDASTVVLESGTAAVTLIMDFIIVLIMLSAFGGIRPRLRPRLVGAGAGAVAVGLLKFLAGSIVAWSLDKPQYGAMAIPITILLILYLLALTLYLSASLTAGLAEAPVEAPGPAAV